MRSRSRGSSISVASALPTSASDLSSSPHRVADSYRRAFSTATAAWAASSCELLVLLGELLAAGLLGEVQVPVGDAAQEDRDSEKALHRRVVRRETDRARIGAELGQPQRLGVSNQDAEMPRPRGKSPMRPMVSSSSPVVTKFSRPVPL